MLGHFQIGWSNTIALRLHLLAVAQAWQSRSVVFVSVSIYYIVNIYYRPSIYYRLIVGLLGFRSNLLVLHILSIYRQFHVLNNTLNIIYWAYLLIFSLCLLSLFSPFLFLFSLLSLPLLSVFSPSVILNSLITTYCYVEFKQTIKHYVGSLSALLPF